MHIKKGDTVKILTGDDKGRTGKIMRLLPKTNQVVVEGVRIVKKHQRARKQNQKGQIIDKVMPIHVSNVARVGQKESSKKK